MTQPTLLVIGAGPLHCYTIIQAKALGLRVICTDQSAHTSGVTLADSFVALDVYDIEGHRHLARHLTEANLVGVTCAGGDAAPTTAAVAEEAGLPGIPFAVAERTWNKYEVRYRLEKAGLAHYQPRWVRCYERGLVHQLADYVGYPYIMKPLSQRASRGISLVEHAWQTFEAFAHATAFGSPILIEERLIGSEHSAEVVFDASGHCVHFHVADRFFDYSHGIPIEVGHINPSRLTPPQRAAILAMLFESATAMGVTIGSWKCDVILTAEGPKIIEATARCSGGYDAQLSYPRSSGDNLLRRVIQVACGAEPTLQPAIRPNHFCAVASIIPRKAGVVRSLPPSMGGEVIWAIQLGGTVQPPEHCAQRAGFVVVDGEDAQETWETAWHLANIYALHLGEVTA